MEKLTYEQAVEIFKDFKILFETGIWPGGLQPKWLVMLKEKYNYSAAKQLAMEQVLLAFAEKLRINQ